MADSEDRIASTETQAPPAREGLSHHILPTSATMLGVCMTGIGLVKLVETRTGPSRMDELFAVDALVFLASALLSYLSIRRRSRRLESLADVLFMAGLGFLALGGLVFAFALI